MELHQLEPLSLAVTFAWAAASSCFCNCFFRSKTFRRLALFRSFSITSGFISASLMDLGSKVSSHFGPSTCWCISLYASSPKSYFTFCQNHQLIKKDYIRLLQADIASWRTGGFACSGFSGSKTIVFFIVTSRRQYVVDKGWMLWATSSRHGCCGSWSSVNLVSMD